MKRFWRRFVRSRGGVLGVAILAVVLAVVFFLFQAPDVALSEIVVATIALPIMIVLAVAKLREQGDE